MSAKYTRRKKKISLFMFILAVVMALYTIIGSVVVIVKENEDEELVHYGRPIWIRGPCRIRHGCDGIHV